MKKFSAEEVRRAARDLDSRDEAYRPYYLGVNKMKRLKKAAGLE